MVALAFGRMTVAVGVALLTLTACSTRTQDRPAAAECAPENQRYCAAAVGDLLDVTLADLRPTQPSLGYDEVYYRLGRYTLGEGAADQLLDQWCVTNGQQGLASATPGATISDPASFTCAVAVGAETDESRIPMKTVVIGPGGQLYLTDGHHTLTSFWEAPGGGPDTRIRLRVTGNLSSSEPDAFWSEMVERGWTWLQDADGKPVAPDALPKSLGLKQFGNDQYRGALYFVRDVGYRQDDDSPAFQEFYWGRWLRDQTDPDLRPADFTLTDMASYQTLIGNVGRAMVALSDTTEIANGQDAKSLGKLEAFGQKAFDALPAPIGSEKPGKLAYAIAYKATL
ncbi:MAG: ParB/Srx family N-terminal domain-containing protein [Mycobacterium sp.]